MMDTKQVIVMRNDLNMRKGKMVAQGAHASMAFMSRNYGQKLTEAEKHWIANSFAKICVRVESLEELMEVHDKALRLGLKSNVITDSGRTEFGGVATVTCLAIGPDWVDKIDQVTGSLKLL